MHINMDVIFSLSFGLTTHTHTLSHRVVGSVVYGADVLEVWVRCITRRVITAFHSSWSLWFTSHPALLLYIDLRGDRRVSASVSLPVCCSAWLIFLSTGAPVFFFCQALSVFTLSPFSFLFFFFLSQIKKCIWFKEQVENRKIQSRLPVCLKRTCTFAQMGKNGKKCHDKYGWKCISCEYWCGEMVQFQCKTDQNWLCALWDVICKLPSIMSYCHSHVCVCIAVNSGFINKSCVTVSLVHRIITERKKIIYGVQINSSKSFHFPFWH